MKRPAFLFLVGVSALLGACGLQGVFGSVEVAVEAPDPLEAVRYEARSAQEGALLAKGEVPVSEGLARLRAPVVQGGSKVLLEGLYDGYAYFEKEVQLGGALDYPVKVKLDAEARLKVSPKLVFLNAPLNPEDRVVVCLAKPAFAPVLNEPYCSTGFVPVAAETAAGELTVELPKGPAYEVLYLTSSRVYRASWAEPEAPTWTFDLNATPWEGR